MTNEIQAIIFFVLLGILVIFLLYLFIFKVKHLKPNDVYMIDGGVKVGKTLITVMLAIKAIFKSVFGWFIRMSFRRFANLFRKLRKKAVKDLDYKPMLYSNMPLYHVKYNPLTLDIIFGKVRIPYHSVVLIDEATLLADSMLGMITPSQRRERFDEVNEALTLFIKTYGHATHGGKLFYNSQNVIDLHFAFKRNTSCYLWVARTRKYPFFCLSEVREVVHDEAHDVVNVVTQDVEVDNRPLFVSKRWFKYYDRYYLDVLYKNLPLYVNYDVPKFEKKITHIDIQEILTLGTYKRILEYNEKNKVVAAQQVNDKEVKENEKA